MHQTVPPTVQPATSCEGVEALAELTHLAQRHKGRLPAELLARHVLAIYGSAGWPVQRAALEALLRRHGFARRDGLRVAERPSAGPFGLYATRRPRSQARPYKTVLAGLGESGGFGPVRGSCDCADFRRGSLGLCKHLLVVLEDLASRPRVFKRAVAEEPAASSRARLSWDPIRPLLGNSDWMERICLLPGTAKISSETAAQRALARRFTRRVGAGAMLERTFADDPRRRLALVIQLSDALRAARRRAPVSEPGLLARLEEERARLERTLVLSKAAARLERTLGSLKQPLYPYQAQGLKRFLSEGRLLLADDMGLGKTAQAIGACHTLFRAGLVKRGLLVVPASLKHQWLREWGTFTDTPVQIIDGSPSERAALYRATRTGFLIANYEQVLRDLELMQGWRPELVVLDEAQRIKNWAAKTSHGVKQLRPTYRLVLTGTPMENRLEELASIFDWVDDHALEPKWRLLPFHAEYADGKKGLTGVRHLDVLRERIAHCTVRRVRGEILKQLPARTDTGIPVPLTPEQQEQHDELRLPIAKLTATASKRPLTQPEFLRLMQLLNTQRVISNGLAQLDFQSVWPALRERPPSARLLRSLFSPKLAELRELVQQLVVEQGRKVVVFSQWRRMLRLAHWAVGDLLLDQGLGARFFTGAEGAKRRTQNLVDFHDDERVTMLFATDAGGVGLNLQRAANACINLELPWNPAVLEQRVGRIHRLGQTDPIDVYALYGAGGIEERIASVVADKQELFRGLFDGESEAVRFEGAGSFLAGLARSQGEDAGAAAPRAVEAQPEEADEDGAELEGSEASELEDLLAAADEATDEATDVEPAGALPGSGHPESPSDHMVRELFQQLTVETTEQGGLRIEAPPEAASALAALFEGMASLLKSGARS